MVTQIVKAQKLQLLRCSLLNESATLAINADPYVTSEQQLRVL